MREVAILGAGELGGAIAHRLARRDIVSSIRLVDDAGAIAAGKALDIMQASPIEHFATSVSGSTDVYSAAGADLVVIAGNARGENWEGAEGLALLRLVAHFQRAPIVLCAGPGHRELVERGCRELGMSIATVFGSAPEALAAALRAFVALEVDGSPRDVALTVLGVPPHHVVVPWDDATIGGIALPRILDATARRRLATRAASAWPPGPHALAAAAVKAIEGVVGVSRQVICGFVAPDDSVGRRARAAAVAIVLDRTGIAKVETPALNAHDQVAFDNATLL